MLQHSSLKEVLIAAADISLWVWVTILFGLQTLVSMILIRLLKLPGEDVVLPMLLLFSGTLMAAILGLRDKRKGLRRWSYWLPAVIYALFIFSLSHRSFSAGPVSLPSDYFHPIEYGTFGIFLCLVWRPLIERRGIKAFVLIVLSSGFVYGIFDEVHQGFIPGRNSSLFDLALDLLGLSMGCAAFLTVRHIVRRTRASRLKVSPMFSGEKNI